MVSLKFPLAILSVDIIIQPFGVPDFMCEICNINPLRIIIKNEKKLILHIFSHQKLFHADADL